MNDHINVLLKMHAFGPGASTKVCGIKRDILSGFAILKGNHVKFTADIFRLYYAE